MKKVLFTHMVSILLVTLFVAGLLLAIPRNLSKTTSAGDAQLNNYLQLKFLNINNPFQLALLQDVLDAAEPEGVQAHNSLITRLKNYETRQLEMMSRGAITRQELTWNRFFSLLLMFFRFLAIYLAVLFITYYAVETLAVYRFISTQADRPAFGHQMLNIWGRWLGHDPSLKKISLVGSFITLLFKTAVKALAYLVLFAPAYVIAYSVKSDFETSSDLFMILLAVFSNGLLLTYSNKFYTFLRNEARKGYVETARVKNLDARWEIDVEQGISHKRILHPLKDFQGHILQHIFINARFQYVNSIKEQASFLITGLMIIEMALNIHKHLSYELLQQILYRNYSIVLVILILIFYLVKFTEIGVDMLRFKWMKKIGM